MNEIEQHPGAAHMAPTRRNMVRGVDDPEPQVVDPRNWNVPLALMLTITALLVAGAFKVALIWTDLDSRLQRIESKQDAAAQVLSDVMPRRAFEVWVSDTEERNGASWKPARIP